MGERGWVEVGGTVEMLLEDGWRPELGSMLVERGQEVAVVVLRRRQRRMRKREGLVGLASVVTEL